MDFYDSDEDSDEDGEEEKREITLDDFDGEEASNGLAKAGAMEVGKRVMKLLNSDDNNDVDHIRNMDKADQIAGNYSTAQQATQGTQAATQAAEAAKAAKAAE